jgi:hypothetical protein
MKNQKIIGRLIALIAVILFGSSFCQEDEIPPPEIIEIRLEDHTREAGLEFYQMTFGVAVSDMNNDGHDDLVVGNHGEPPSLFLRQGSQFGDFSELLPERVTMDRHGVTAIDLDNDGDRDLVFAGGGADGVGAGCRNRLYRNEKAGSGVLAFQDISSEVGIDYQSWRTRHFLPLPGPDGSLVDLFMVCLVRENCPDLYFSNRSSGSIELEVSEIPGLGQDFSSEGRDIFFDYDRDGDQDLLIISRSRPRFFERVNSGYQLNEGLFPSIPSVFCLACGDLNNDGYLDVYLGREAVKTKSDNLSYNQSEIHFVFRKHDDDHFDRINFYIDGNSVFIDFIQHLPTGETILDPSNIFVGMESLNPEARKATITAEMANGEPLREKPGTYIWKDSGMNLWHLEWVYGNEEQKHKGRLMAETISNLTEDNLEIVPAQETNDLIFINQEGMAFVELVMPELVHQKVTRAVAMCDLNNDGRLDIIGLRGGEEGQVNGDPFLFTNRGDLSFDFKWIMQNDEDDIFQADQLVWGFFNNDGLPDIFFTNGFGLNPGQLGPYKMYLNRTQNPGNYVIVDLEGVAGNRDALGAEVELVNASNDLLGYRQLGAGFNRSQSTHKLHFGLGDTVEELRVRIRWPGTSTWDEREIQINQTNRFVQQM